MKTVLNVPYILCTLDPNSNKLFFRRVIQRYCQVGITHWYSHSSSHCNTFFHHLSPRYKKILPPHTTSVVQSGGKHLDTASDATAGAAATAAEAPEALDPELCAEIRRNYRS